MKSGAGVPAETGKVLVENMLFLRKHLRHNSAGFPLPLLLLVTKLPPHGKSQKRSNEGTMPKEKPQVNIGEVIKTYRGQRGLSQGDIERRTGLLRCYLSRVENGHTVPSLETLAKIAEAMDISLADFFPGTETPRDKETQKMLGELSQDEIRFLVEIKRYSSTLSDGDKRLVLAMIRKMATMIPPPVRRPLLRRPAV
jgi:transcriptional regulator with XRE-family HTH domain